MREWKLLAMLGSSNLIVGAFVLAVGVAYDVLGKAPGQLAIAGAALMSGPFLILARWLKGAADRSSAVQAAEHRKVLAEAEEAEHRAAVARVSRGVATGSFAALPVQESGALRLTAERRGGMET